MSRSMTSRYASVMIIALMSGFVGIGTTGCKDADPLAEVRELQAAGRLEESLEPLRELIAKMPESAEVHYRYGLALSRTGSPGMAVWSLRRAQADPEWAVGAGLELGHAAIAARSWANAIQASDRVLEADPDNLAALKMRAEAHLGQMKHPELALEDLEHAIDLSPDDVGLKIARARALLMDERLEEATEAVAELEATHRDLSSSEAALLGPLCVLRAVFEKEKGDLDKAEAELEGCLERYATDATVIHSALDFYDEQRMFERGNQLLRDAIEVVPSSLRYRATLASRLRSMDKVDEAESVLLGGLESMQGSQVTAVWTELARHYAEIGAASEAADAYGEAIALAPQVSELGWLTYADMLAGAERNDEALKVSSNLKTDMYKQLVEAHVRLNEGQPRKAIELLDEVLPLWPNNAGARYFAARAAEQLGDFDRAIAEYRQSIRSDASVTDAGIRLAEILLALGDESSAWTAVTHHLKAQPQDRAGQILAMRMATKAGPSPKLRAQLNQALNSRYWPTLVAIYADSVARRAGPAVAVERLRDSSRLDFSNPRAADALLSLVTHLAAVDGEQAELRAALAAHPDDPDILAIAGYEKELRFGDPAAGRADYERAVELDPEQIVALGGLSRIARASDERDEAQALLDRAAEVDPENLSARREAAEYFERNGADGVEAQARWQQVSRDFPWDSETALHLARRALMQSNLDSALSFAQRSVRLRGGAPAWELIAEIRDKRHEAELASEARRKAEALRSRS